MNISYTAEKRNRVNSLYLEIVANRLTICNNIDFVINKQCEPRGDVTLCDESSWLPLFYKHRRTGLVKKKWPTNTLGRQKHLHYSTYTHIHTYVYIYICKTYA